MTAANFPAELADELVFEGGWSDNPADPGGATNFGITLATLSHWLGRPASLAELHGLAPAMRSAIYRGMFWNAIQGDALPSGIDLVTFDMAVNGGPSQSARMLQRVLVVTPDGVIGARTIAAAVRSQPRLVVSVFSADREVFYRSLPGFRTFGTGWLARVTKCEDEALALAE